MRRIEGITEALILGGRGAQTPAAVIQWGARPEQRVLVATLGTLAARVREAGLSNPSVIVVGDVVTLRETLRWYDKGALFGKRLLLPRPLQQAKSTAKEIRRIGAVPVVYPLIAIEDPEDPSHVLGAVGRLSTYDWVILTSANGAERLIAAIRKCGRDARAFGNAKIAVIGPKTAEPLLGFGLTADLIAEEHVAEGLLKDLRAQGEMRRVLLFRAAEARELLPDSLRDAGVEVDVVAAYRTRRLGAVEAEPLRQMFLERSLDAVLVTSSSMATSLVEALGADAKSLLGQVCIASIGPVTTNTLEQLGVTVHVTATKYTVSGLLSALELTFGKQAGEKSC